jgi:uncharacterized lipoprotein YddW (UPF0748 family)
MSRRTNFSLGLVSILLLITSSCTSLEVQEEVVEDDKVQLPQLRGIWVQARSVTSREKIDTVLQRVEAGGFNSIFVNVFYNGQAIYDSALAEKYNKVEAGFDPLGYLVPEAQRRGIKVHAWYVVGRIENKGSPIFWEHPDWSLTGPDGDTIPWLNFTRPDVRQFISDLMMETIERYGVDGLHFDYTRYPGSEWGFDLYSIQSFNDEYGHDLNQMRYADLPAYGLFEGNPLTMPDSGQVLASFSDGTPAVVINRYGKGESILLNWNATKRTVAIGGEILQNSLVYFVPNNGRVYILRSEVNEKEYGYGSFENTLKWLMYLGWSPMETDEVEIKRLNTHATLVLPNLYLISSEAAADLADFVNRGGKVIFIDGPTRSIFNKEIQLITGMQSRGVYFKGNMLMTANETHHLLPLSTREADADLYWTYDVEWKEFRRKGINTLIRDIYERVNEKYPHVDVSATITSDQLEARERYLQDWETWLEGDYVDFLVPRGYVNQIDELSPVLLAWNSAIQRYRSHITFGLITYTKQEEAKPPEQLLAEIEKALRAGSNGYMIFDMDRLSEEQLSVFENLPTVP